MARITSYQQILKMRDAGVISDVEWRLIENCQAGQSTVLNDGVRPERADPQVTVQAEVLRYLILGGCDACRVDERGVWLRGAYITGRLDLDYVTARGATALTHCRFDSKVYALRARLGVLNLAGSHCPGLNAHGVQVAGDVFLRDGFLAKDEVRLSGSEIGGQLACVGGEFDNADGYALNADAAQVAGDVILVEGFSAKGAVSLTGAEIGGQWNCRGGSFDNVEGFALLAQDLRVASIAFFSDGFTAKGAVSLLNAKVGDLNLQGCQIECVARMLDGVKLWALRAEGIEVSGRVLIGGGSRIIGGTQFSGAKVGNKFAVEGCVLCGHEGDTPASARPALDAGGLSARRISWKSAEITGDVRFNDATCETLNDKLEAWAVQGRLNLDGFVYEHLARVGNFHARLAWAKRSVARDGEFSPQPLRHLAKVLRDMGHDGEARKALVEKERGVAREKRRLMMAQDGRGAHDPSRLARLVAGWVSDAAVRWLIGYGYYPWRTLGVLSVLFVLATGLFHHSYERGFFAPNAGVILVSEGWQQIANLPRCDAGAVMSVTTEPCTNNAAASWSERGFGGQDYESFNRYAYAADVVIPILDLGQERAWAPSTTRGLAGQFDWGTVAWWARWLFAVLGWIITALGAAAITGIIRRE